MATITYTDDSERNSVSPVNVRIIPASDAEVIIVDLGFHPSAVTGIKGTAVTKTAMLYWSPLLTQNMGIVGYDFAADDGTLLGTFIATSIALYGPDPLIGDGVSKERLPLGIQVFGGLVTEAIDLFITCHR